MADSIAVRISTDGISKKLLSMLDKGQLASGWLNRVAYPMIIASHRVRWASEGASEGRSWPALNPAYASRKLKRYADYPGGGRKMLIATGKLVASMTGDETQNHYKLVIENRLEVGTTLGYAKYVDEKRPITILSSQTRANLSKSLNDYLDGRAG